MNDYFRFLQEQYKNPKKPQEKGLIFLSETNMSGQSCILNKLL